MLYYFFVVIVTSLFCLGLTYVVKKPFFIFTVRITSLLDTMLNDTVSEDAKQQMMTRKLASMLTRFFSLLAVTVFVLIVALMPLVLYQSISSSDFSDFDTNSIGFYTSMIVGSLILLILPSQNKKKDYSDWSTLLHHIILDNYHIHKTLFRLDKRFSKSKLGKKEEPFVIVSGLARSGTTAITKLLYASNSFYSLTYANMPFLLAPNIWSKFYRPSKNRGKERTHGDQVMFGYKSIEALEEYFFKAFLSDSFIEENYLSIHNLSDKTYKEYLAYQQLIKPKGADTIYLAKNNNLILRYESLRSFNGDFIIILMLRNPIDHAESLLKQHIRFSQLQDSDPFVVEYMDWLGHHEFGNNHKIFDFGREYSADTKDKFSINFWLLSWINYHSQVKDYLQDKRLYIVDYNDLLKNPKLLISTLSKNLNIDLTIDEITPFQKTEMNRSEIDIQEKFKAKSLLLYEELMQYKMPLIA